MAAAGGGEFHFAQREGVKYIEGVEEPALVSNAKVVRIRAVLQNPGCGDAQPFCTVSDTASLSL